MAKANTKYIVLAISIFISVGIVKYFAYDVYYIPTNSMSPAIEPGDRVIVNKWATGTLLPKWINPTANLRTPQFTKIRKGDIILFYHPNKNEPIFNRVVLAKRVIATPGDSLTLKKFGINNLYIPSSSDPQKTNFYFVMGDFAENSHDSRHWGLVPDSLIIGKTKRILYSSHDSIKYWENKKFNWNRFLKEIE